MLATLAIATVAAASPHLAVTSTSPLSVHGTGFRPHEHVSVRYSGNSGVVHRHVRAGDAGAIRATFRSVAVDRCSGYTIVATGTHHDHARVRALPPRECNPL